MIITFDLQNLNASSGDIFVVDNCKDLRITRLTFNKFNSACEIMEHLRTSNDYVCKEWTIPNNTDSPTPFSDDDYNLLEFSSNGLNYYIITEGRVYIANDENKTFKVIK